MVVVSTARKINMSSPVRLPGGPPPPPGNPGALPKTVYVRQGPPRVIPEGNPYTKFDEYSFEYWFNYFYAELPAARRSEFYVRISPTPGVLRTAKDIPDTEKKTLLTDMMDIGFRKYKTTEKLSSVEMFQSLKTMTRPEPSRVMFRGDSREPEAIQRNSGTKPQTQLPHLYAERGFDKSWHPWNDQNRRDSVYFRNGDVNQDNCLFSAISVTPEFYIATKFPMMNQVKLGKAIVEVEMIETGGPSRVASMVSRFDNKKTLTLSCSRTNIYAVKVKKGWNTESFQAQTFAERAYDNLRWIDHFAIVKVIRIHYGVDSNKGHLAVIDSWKLLPDNDGFDSNIRASMKKLNATNPAAVNQLIQGLRSFLQATSSECRLLNGVGGHSYLPEGVKAPFNIKKVVSMTW
jgi:hypothetical protein